MFGICFLSLIPMRLDSNHRSELVNQVLYGEVFEILSESEDKNWVEIKLKHDSYIGWVTKNQIKVIPKVMFEVFSLDLSIIYNIENQADSKSKLFLWGSIVNESPKLLKIKFDQEKFIRNSLLYLDSPYLWGGRTIWGIDCSGFVQIIARLSGFYILRDAWQQEKSGVFIGFNDKKIGDCAFFGKNGKITHVGFVWEGNEIIHAHGRVRIDEFRPDGIFNNELKILTHELISIKRILI